MPGVPLHAMRRALGVATYFFAGAAGVLAVAYFELVHVSEPPLPHLSARIEHDNLRVGDRVRSFSYYAPARLPASAALLIAFHGAGQTGEEFRAHTGYGFDRLADARGFVVVYPDGYAGHWNDCRKAASFSARKLHIDDVAFVHALIDHFHSARGIDPTRVFATGHSNGGQMAYRVALELPEQVRAIAAISAALPTPDNLDCQESEKAIPTLIMNGTQDPINPYDGGRVTPFGFGTRGNVRSSMETAVYFAQLGGLANAPSTERLPGAGGGLWVERSTWGAPGILEVVLDTIHGGGHVVPQGAFRYPRILGATDLAFDGPTEIWNFFERQPTRR